VTLVELLVVMAIIAVLASILVPGIAGVRRSAMNAQTLALMQTVTTAFTQFREEKQRLPGVFSQDAISSAANLSGFTQMENALLDLAGGVDPRTDLGAAHAFEVRMGDQSVRINTRMVGCSGGPGYLPLACKGLDSNEPQANGIAPARPGIDQIIDPNRGPDKREMPDLLDAWGRPIILWSRNEFSGPNPVFSGNFSPQNATERRARFYWASNRGYLEAPSQASKSALGAGAEPSRRLRSIDAILGDPAMPNPASGGQEGHYVPLTAKGDFMLHTTGRDGLFMDNGGNPRVAYRYNPGDPTLFTNPGSDAGDRYLRAIEELDDVLIGVN
jgi:type II secretory pathway pseudopilin PulG